MGGIVARTGGAEVAALRQVGEHLGLAFQITDDILDHTADTVTLGKTAGKDARADKTTYVKLHGLAAARDHADRQTAAALAALEKLPGDSSFLAALTTRMANRPS
jgi:geranylgeranyl pyrophosphate synthase